MNRRTILALFLIFGFITVNICGYAQSESYLDTIYQAGDKGSAAALEEEDVNYVTDPEEPPEIVDIPEQKGLPEQQEALNRLQNIINNIMRILGGKMCGTKIVIVVIPCDKIVPKPPAEPEPTPDPTPDPAPDPQPDPDPAPEPDPAPQPDPTPDPEPAPQPDPAPDPQPEPDPAPEQNPGDKPDDVAGMRSYIQQKYGISCTDGDQANWSINQIKAADEAFESLPEFFRNATQVVYRDGPAPSFAPPTVLGYVIVPQRKIHMMDLSTKMTQSLYNALTAAYGRPPTQEEQLYALKRNFQGTLVHEMTHCFQNTYPQVYQSWKNTFNCSSSPTGYGKTQPAEDMAESVRVYWSGGKIQNGKFISNGGIQMDLDRYEFIKAHIMKGKEFLN
jgi:hypothetical protein